MISHTVDVAPRHSSSPSPASLRAARGAAYVISGKSSSSRVSLARLTNRGVRAVGARRGDGVGSCVALIGDVSSDGLSELLMEGAAPAPRRSSHRDRVGPTYVVRGRSGSRAVSLRNRVAGDSLQPSSRRPGAGLGRTCGGAGDVNGDGHPDMIDATSGRSWVFVTTLRPRGRR